MVAALVSKAFQCPRCGHGFHVRAGYDETAPGFDGSGSGFGVNVFSRRCLNCGLDISGRGDLAMPATRRRVGKR
jgi:transcription elongation factor Elf1